MPRPPRRPMSAGRGRGSTNGNARGEEGREAPPSRKRQERRSTAKWARLSAPTNRNSQRGAARQSERGGRGLRAVSSALVRTPQRESRFEPPHHGQPIGRRLAPPPAAPPPPLLPVPPPGFGGIPPPGLGVTPGPNQRGAETGGDPLPNPGAFEECHRKCKELFPVQMEGVKLTVNKGLSNHFQVNHTVALSTLGESNYHFGATYVGTKQLSPTEAFPVLVGDMDNSGSLNAQIIHQLTARLRSKVAFQVKGLVSLQYPNGECWSTRSTGARGGLVYLQCPERVYPHYIAPNWIGTLTLGQAGAHATYYHRANEQLQVGVELEASARLRDTSVTFGYQLELPRGHLLFRGTYRPI
ncbi:hypothetical protein Q9233_000689 [Columba guinea]|nr:hypothetical protein Q9233_000689 [Columba guinea]